MKKAIPDFDQLWATYPTGQADDVKRRIGGRVDYGWITNTCAIRMSRSFNYSGARIPTRRRGLNTVSGGDGLRYAYRVTEFSEHWMRREYGRPSVNHVNDDEGGPIPEAFRGKKGVIRFVVPSFDDATGHLDLWDGARCIGHGYWNVAKEIQLWGADAPFIAGSVGSRGRNAPADVRAVQSLLAEAGHDPGPIDGISGARTRAAIRAFQSSFLSEPDGRVDVDGGTWTRLVETTA